MQGQVEDLQTSLFKLTRVLKTIQDNVASLHEDEDYANEEDETLAIEPTISITQLGESSKVLDLKMERYSDDV